jgi:RNA polymerase sigma-70 factor (ECF subfamily)
LRRLVCKAEGEDAGYNVDYSTLDDKTLISLIARNHPDALSALYDRYHRLVFSLAVGIIEDQAVAEEITLDVFTRVWEKAATYQPQQAKVRTWLTSIARNQAIDILRRRNVRPEQNSIGWAELPPQAVPYVDNLEEMVELTLQRDRIRAALSHLSPEQKTTLAMVYFRGLTHRQVAETLDQPLGTVKTRLRLALKKLRDVLWDEEKGASGPS